jgi:peptide subunit release factor 1 (eRF1)
MSGYRYADLLSLRLTCSDPQCGQSFQKSLAQLAAKSAVPCPRCSRPVDLGGHRPAIEKLVELAVALERQASS